MKIVFLFYVSIWILHLGGGDEFVRRIYFQAVGVLFCNQLKWELDFEERRVSFMK